MKGAEELMDKRARDSLTSHIKNKNSYSVNSPIFQIQTIPKTKKLGYLIRDCPLVARTTEFGVCSSLLSINVYRNVSGSRRAKISKDKVMNTIEVLVRMDANRREAKPAEE